jgi:hypothetical protein
VCLVNNQLNVYKKMPGAFTESHYKSKGRRLKASLEHAWEHTRSLSRNVCARARPSDLHEKVRACLREQIQDWFVDRQTCIVKKQAKLFHIETSARAGGVKLLIKVQFSNPRTSTYAYCIIFIFNTHAHVQAEPLQQSRCMHEHIHVLAFVCLCLCIVFVRKRVSFCINIHT